MAIEDAARKGIERGDVARRSDAREATPPTGLELRAMRAADLDDVLAIEHVAFAMPWSSITYRNLLRRRDAELLVAELPGPGVVGYTVCWRVLDEAELGNIAVAPAWRGRGVARALLERVIVRAAAKGVRALFLEVRVSNERARRLYAAAGFRQVGMRRNYYAFPLEDALVLRRDV
ncbi:MAG: ribosomal protein S18-alanine N-acetyltransferase [Longimicrobiales bacterium]